MPCRGVIELIESEKVFWFFKLFQTFPNFVVQQNPLSGCSDGIQLDSSYWKRTMAVSITPCESLGEVGRSFNIQKFAFFRKTFLASHKFAILRID